MPPISIVLYFLGYDNERTTKITKKVKTEQGSAVVIDIEALHKVLNNPKYADYPVAVYSIIGSFRSGKSFLLNNWIHYIKSQTVSI